ncbi:GNAT family N-acetyltransferase [Glutamicibacter endophyticus]|uniref:GNAT family N-acetyltransferase n=1 Tax=Glutamicibacter endophyticus TaxID=1522174 RepID=UPI003AF11215
MGGIALAAAADRPPGVRAMIAHLDLPVDLPKNELRLRRAVSEDLDALLRLLSDDPISAARGDAKDRMERAAYAAALEEIIDDPANDQLVVEHHGELVAMMQVTRTPGLARGGSCRLTLEAVRVASHHRSLGIGTQLMRWAIDVAAVACGASLVQLTSDAARTDAHRFYTRLGFTASHTGFKYRV